LLSVHHDGSTDRPSITVGDKVLPMHPDAAGVSRLDLWLDGSVLELFVDGREVLTTRCYAFPNLDPKVTMAWTGSASALRTLSRAIVRPISTNKLASAT
jgi:hypothetical protein